MINVNQKRICQQIVNIFETGAAKGDYSDITLIPGDSGGLTYGRSQTTLNSGNLSSLLEMFLSRAQVDDAYKYNALVVLLQANLYRFIELDQSLNGDKIIHAILKELGKTALMQVTQDDFFDEVYWQPAADMCEALKLKLALSWGIVYDSYIHGGFNIVRKKFPELPPHKGGDEKVWTQAYVKARRKWLLTNTSESKPYTADDKTIYRMDAFQDLIDKNNWDLVPPLKIRGVTIT